MIRKNKFAILLTTVFVLSTILICTLFCTGVVFADYEDVQNDLNSIVNFNQYIKIESATNPANTFTANSITVGENILSRVNITSFNLISGHKYYLKSNVSSETMFYLGNAYTQYYGFYTRIITSGTTETVNSIVISSTATLNYEFYFSVIDLTQMFGAGNEPLLAQCNDLFVSDYYGYNTGSSMSLSGLNSYSQGFNDAVGGFEWTQTNSNFLISMQGVNKGIYQGSVSVYNNTYLRVENSDTASYYLTCYMPFNFVVPVGSNISFKGIFTHDYGHASENLVFCYFDVNNQPVTLATASFSGGANYGVNVSFTAPVDLSGVYMYLDELDGPTYFGCYNAAFSMLTLDPYAAIQTAYDNGYKMAQDYYSIDGIGGQQIYNQGKADGISQANDYTFSSLMFSVINAPLQAVLNIFNFDFMGYNLKNFITIILTLCLILSIVNLFMGGK